MTTYMDKYCKAGVFEHPLFLTFHQKEDPKIL